MFRLGLLRYRVGMIWESLKGHRRTVDLFRRAMRRQRGAHAYLLIGPEGVGKRRFATGLAQCLFCERTSDAELEACGECAACRQVQAGTHPDLLAVSCPEGKRELPISLMIGDRDKRGKEGLCHEFVHASDDRLAADRRHR